MPLHQPVAYRRRMNITVKSCSCDIATLCNANRSWSPLRMRRLRYFTLTTALWSRRSRRTTNRRSSQWTAGDSVVFLRNSHMFSFDSTLIFTGRSNGVVSKVAVATGDVSSFPVASGKCGGVIRRTLMMLLRHNVNLHPPVRRSHRRARLHGRPDSSIHHEKNAAAGQSRVAQGGGDRCDIPRARPSSHSHLLIVRHRLLLGLVQLTRS